MSPVGSWQGTLTTTTGGSGTEPFVAEIDLVDPKTSTYEGSLNVGTEAYCAVGGYNPYISEDHFTLRTTPAELGAALSPGPPFYGTEWYGEMTEDSWEGEWYLRTKDAERSREGTFKLERLP